MKRNENTRMTAETVERTSCPQNPQRPRVLHACEVLATFLEMPALRNKAVRNTAVTRAMAKDEESTAGISKKVARTSQACKTLGRWGFWGQLVLSTVSAVILVFSFLFKGITKVRHAASSIPSPSNRSLG